MDSSGPQEKRRKLTHPNQDSTNKDSEQTDKGKYIPILRRYSRSRNPRYVKQVNSKQTQTTEEKKTDDLNQPNINSKQTNKEDTLVNITHFVPNIHTSVVSELKENTNMEYINNFQTVNEENVPETNTPIIVSRCVKTNTVKEVKTVQKHVTVSKVTNFEYNFKSNSQVIETNRNLEQNRTFLFLKKSDYQNLLTSTQPIIHNQNKSAENNLKPTTVYLNRTMKDTVDLMTEEHKKYQLKRKRIQEFRDAFKNCKSILPEFTYNGEPIGLNDLKFVDLQVIIPLLIRQVNRNQAPNWKNANTRASWWPEDIPWAPVKVDTRSDEDKLKKKWTTCLKEIVENCYSFYGCHNLLRIPTNVPVLNNTQYLLNKISDEEITEMFGLHDNKNVIVKVEDSTNETNVPCLQIDPDIIDIDKIEDNNNKKMKRKMLTSKNIIEKRPKIQELKSINHLNKQKKITNILYINKYNIKKSDINQEHLVLNKVNLKKFKGVLNKIHGEPSTLLPNEINNKDKQSVILHTSNIQDNFIIKKNKISRNKLNEVHVLKKAKQIRQSVIMHANSNHIKSCSNYCKCTVEKSQNIVTKESIKTRRNSV